MSQQMMFEMKIREYLELFYLMEMELEMLYLTGIIMGAPRIKRINKLNLNGQRNAIWGYSKTMYTTLIPGTD